MSDSKPETTSYTIWYRVNDAAPITTVNNNITKLVRIAALLPGEDN